MDIQQMVDNKDIIELNNIELKKECISYTQKYEIPRLDDGSCYHDFLEQYLLNNQPCIVKSSVFRNWFSYKQWIADGKPEFVYLREKYGHIEVPVADCGEKYYNVQKKSTILLSEFLCYWKDYILKDYPSHMPCLYLKDWHFIQDCAEEEVYRVPQYFASDWLNEYFSSKQDIIDDYKFVYMGPKGSWTPLHADVFTSFSWSINICGRKRWLLFPPGQEDYLRDKYGKLAYDATLPDMLDNTLFPKYNKYIVSYDIIQESGEAIFVPSGWHHQVWNLEDTISINHNWINGCNIENMWKSLQFNLAAVKQEVNDCKDMEEWEEHCQLMLRATYGINYEEFYTFLSFIGRRRLDYILGNSQCLIVFGGWRIGKKHALFDLQQLKRVLNSFIADSDTVILNFFKKLGNQPEQFILEIVKMSTIGNQQCVEC